MSAKSQSYASRFGFNLPGGGTPVGVTEIGEGAGPAVQPVDLPLRLFPPVNWENIDLLSYVALPAIGTTATILQFTVPIGRNGIIRKVANNFVGGGWTEGSGAVIWRILADGAPPPGASTYNSILGSLGSPANPVEIPGFRIFENQVISVVINNVSIVVAGQLSGARLIGYLYPRELEPPDIWI